jgi:hypothetical protein
MAAGKNQFMQFASAIGGGSKAGGQTTDATSGALQGAMAGAQTGNPYAAAAGAVAGALGARAARKQKGRELKAQAMRENAKVEQQRGQNISNALGNIMSSFQSSLV